jgi:uncharacterized membrane protein
VERHLSGTAIGFMRRLELSERVGILAAVSGVGHSFSRGLLPRATADQAVITGVSLTVNYAMTALAQSLTESMAHKVVSRAPVTRAERAAHRGVLLAGNAAAIGGGMLAQRALEQRADEPIWRAWGRTLSWRLTLSGAAGATILSIDTALDALSADGRRTWMRQVPVALPLGGVLAAASYHKQRQLAAAKGAGEDAEGVSLDESMGVSTLRSVALGTAVATGLFVTAEVERYFADGVAGVVRHASPRADLLAKPVGHLAALGLLAGAGAWGIREIFAKAEQGGAAVEAAYRTPPTSAFVSGGPNSNVLWEDIGREGRRFVNMALTTDEIEAVMGEPAIDPIRVFVGLGSADTTSGRADLAMRELEQLGAFERKLIVFCSPTGTGYLNYVTAEALEYLMRGDVALVAMQYSLRPSPQSLDRVNIGIEQNGSFLQALKWRLSAIPKSRRPRLVMFGESLGAQTSQDIFKDEGVAGLHRAGIERALFLGTPAATKWRQRWLSDPVRWDPEGEVVQVDSHKEYLALPAHVRKRARFILLTHHNDPMPKFWFPLAVQAPDWMNRARPPEPGVPHEVHWRPYTTFFITLIDVKNAMHVIPGQFVAVGHDYRKDLARFTSLAYNLPIDDARLEKMEVALRERELQWAERRLVSEQLEGAESKVKEQLLSWGVPEDKIPTVVGSPLPQAVDAYRAEGSPQSQREQLVP